MTRTRKCFLTGVNFIKLLSLHRETIFIDPHRINTSRRGVGCARADHTCIKTRKRFCLCGSFGLVVTCQLSLRSCLGSQRENLHFYFHLSNNFNNLTAFESHVRMSHYFIGPAIFGTTDLRIFSTCRMAFNVSSPLKFDKIQKALVRPNMHIENDIIDR